MTALYFLYVFGIVFGIVIVVFGYHNHKKAKKLLGRIENFIEEQKKLAAELEKKKKNGH